MAVREQVDFSQGQIPTDFGIPELEGVDPSKLAEFDRDLARSWGFDLGIANQINQNRVAVGVSGTFPNEERALQSISETRDSLIDQIREKGYTNDQLREVAGFEANSVAQELSAPNPKFEVENSERQGSLSVDPEPPQVDSGEIAGGEQTADLQETFWNQVGETNPIQQNTPDEGTQEGTTIQDSTALDYEPLFSETDSQNEVSEAASLYRDFAEPNPEDTVVPPIPIEPSYEQSSDIPSLDDAVREDNREEHQRASVEPRIDSSAVLDAIDNAPSYTPPAVQERLDNLPAYVPPEPPKASLSLDNLKRSLNLDDRDRFRIYEGRKTVYAENQGEVIANDLTPETLKLISDAIQNPAGFEGSIRVLDGREKLLHIKDGEVLADSLSLTPQADNAISQQEEPAEQETETEVPASQDPTIQPVSELVELGQESPDANVLQQNTEAETISQESDSTINNVEINKAESEGVYTWLNHPTDATNQLSDQPAKQLLQSQLEQLEKRLEKIESFAAQTAERGVQKAERGIEAVKANPSISSWLDRLKGKANEAFNAVGDKARADIQSVKNAIAEPTTKALLSATTKAAQWLGDDVKGTKVVDAGNARLEVDNGKLNIRERPSVQHDRLLERASEGVESKGLQGVKQIISNAQQLGARDTDIRQALSKHPSIQRLGDKGADAIARLLKTVQRESRQTVTPQPVKSKVAEVQA